MTGLSRQSVSRILGELAEAGVVTVGFRRINVTDAARLDAIANTSE